MEMSNSPWSAAAFGGTFAMWTVMMAVMMMPSALPFMRLVRATNTRAVAAGAADTPPALFGAGYLLAWVVFSALATGLQGMLRSLALLSPALSVRDPRLGGAILLLAGAYQFTPWKGACLAHCRSPLSFILLHWREGKGGAVAMGLRHGIFCVGCCWALMLLMFVVGTGSVGWMLALAAVMAAEKNLRGGERLRTPLGVGLLAWAAGVVLVHFG